MTKGFISGIFIAELFACKTFIWVSLWDREAYSCLSGNLCDKGTAEILNRFNPLQTEK